MAGKDNLIPNSQRSPEEVRANGRKGGIKSGQVRRQKANLKKALNTILLSDVSSEQLAKTLEGLGYDRTNESAMALAMVQKAIKGDVKAFEQVSRLVATEKDEYDIKEQRTRIELNKANVKKATADARVSENKADKLTSDEHTDELLEALVDPKIKEGLDNGDRV